MKQLNRIWTILIVTFVLVMGLFEPARAQSPLPLGEILRKTESYYQQLRAYTAYFRQWTTSSAANAMTTEASGKLYYQKPRQMRWEYEAPDHQVFIANHSLAWLHVPSENQISLFDANTFFTSPLAQTFFDGITELRNHFEVSLDPNRSSETSAVLRLVPKKEDPNIKLLLLWIDLKTFQIARVSTHDALGNINLIMLQSQQAAPQLDGNLFQLDIPPSTFVVDSEGRELTSQEIQQLKQKLLPGRGGK